MKRYVGRALFFAGVVTMLGVMINLDRLNADVALWLVLGCMLMIGTGVELDSQP